MQIAIVTSLIGFGMSFLSIFGAHTRRARRVLLPVTLVGLLLSVVVGVCAFWLLMMSGIRV